MGTSSNKPYIKIDIQSKIEYNAMIEDESKKIFDSLPKDQYLCPFCGDIPELLNIHTDNGCVEFRCKKDKDYLISVQDYFKKLSESNFTYYKIKCYNCKKLQINYKQNEQIFKYCYLCKKDLCYECVEKKFENHDESHLKKCIPINEKNTRCLEHFNEGKYTSFCQDCHANICEENSHRIHRGHHTTNFFKIEPQIKVIEEKNRILSDIIRFNKLILSTYNKFPDNYFHLVNMSNLAGSIMLENSRNSEELNFIFEQLKLKIKNREEAIKSFIDKFKLCLSNKEGKLSLQKIGLENEDLKTLSNLLKIEDNNELGLSLEELNQLLKKYTKKFIYRTYTFEDFNKKYNCQLDKKSKEIKLVNSKFGNEILKDLYILSFKYDNINRLILSNKNIDDISLLSRMRFRNLETLDLSLNQIKSIEPLSKMELYNLKSLFFKGNNTSDFTPLISSKFKNLQYVDISDNNIVEGSAELEKIEKYFVQKKNKIKYKYK